MPNAQSDLSLPCPALTHHIPHKMERKKLPVPNNWILSAERFGRVPVFYLLSSTFKPCLFPPVWSNWGQPLLQVEVVSGAPGPLRALQGGGTGG